MEKYLISKVYIIVGKPRDEDEISEGRFIGKGEIESEIG